MLSACFVLEQTASQITGIRELTMLTKYRNIMKPTEMKPKWAANIADGKKQSPGFLGGLDALFCQEPGGNEKSKVYFS